MRWWEWLILTTCLAIFAGQAALASPLKSAAFDEEYHIAAGYAYLKTGDFRMSASHPPLINTLSAIPLLLLEGVNLPTDDPSWTDSDYFLFSDVFLWQANDNPQQILVYGRVSIILLGTLLVFVLFWWARQMAGPIAGWIALILAMFDPNLIANSRLITTDLGLTCFVTLTMWRLWCWLERPSGINLILTGILAGLTMATKFTGLLIWPVILVVMFLWMPEIRVWRLTIFGREIADWSWGRELRVLVSSLFLMGVVAFITLWAVFRFDFGPVPGTDWSFSIPAPFYPYSVWDTIMVIEEQPKAAFLMGQVSDRGWWYYFPVALLLKTSLPLLLLTAVGSLILFKDEGWRRASILWVPPLFYLLLAMTGRITIGYRHILPLAPFLILMAAQVGRILEIGDWRLTTFGREIDDLRSWDWRLRSGSRSVVVGALVLLLLIWHGVGTLRLWPHQEAFFNELAGGPERGSEYLVDSNIDWGQDLILLRELMAEMGLEMVYLSYFGTALPEAYGLNYKPLPGFMRFTAGAEIDAYNPYTPLPGWYAISETSRRLGLMLQNMDMYAYFQDKEPVVCAGYSICLYEVEYPEDVPVERRVVYGRSVSDIPADELGVQSENQIIIKWARSPDVIITSPQYEVALPESFQPVGADFGGAFTLLGYDLPQTTYQPGESVPLTLYWQVGTAVVDTPHPSQASPLAAFVHISGDDPGNILAQYDGWSTALAGLETGDMIAHPMTIWLPAEAPAGSYFVRAGLYSPQTGERLPVILNGETADFVTLETITFDLSP